MSNTEFINTYFEELKRITESIDRQGIDRAIELLLETWRNDGTVFIMGNGGSASTATHFVCDLAKVTIVGEKKRFKVMGLTDNPALISAWTNDSGFGTIFVEQLKPFLKRGDKSKASFTVDDWTCNAGIGKIFLQIFFSRLNPAFVSAIGHQKVDNAAALGATGTGLAGFLDSGIFKKRKLGSSVFVSQAGAIGQVVVDIGIIHGLITEEITTFFHFVQVNFLGRGRRGQKAGQNHQPQRIKNRSFDGFHVSLSCKRFIR